MSKAFSVAVLGFALLVVALAGGVAVGSAADVTSVVFSYTGGAQTWTVPAGVTEVEITADGAQGQGTYGGLGGRVRATIAVSPGAVLSIYVGGRGVGKTGGFNGGGGGSFGSEAGAGGGASDVRVGGTALPNRVVVGGGGGGGALGASSIFGTGGSGGGLTGEAGGDGNDRFKGGGGGTQTAGGASGGSFGSAGSLGQGAGGGYRAGNGGGGYYGGGTGGSDSTGGSPGGGGGGSSYVSASATSVSYVAGVRAGNGQVTISYPPASSATTAPPGSATFAYTGGPQQWVVPEGVTTISVQAYGGQGDGTYGGFGAMARAVLTVVPGQTLSVMVGGQGVGSTGGFNGGGGGNFGSTAGAGGGASDVRVGGTTLAARALVAGGGGGAAEGAGPVYGQGGSAGFDGKAGGDGNDRFKGGGGGTHLAGGTGGGSFSNVGRLGQGAGGAYKAGDGGGGYYGGGSGGSDSTGGSPGGGGSGSSFADPSASGVSFVTGARRGNGEVTITWPPAPAAVPPSTPAPLTFGYTGGPQFWSVPEGIAAIDVDAAGAQGDAAWVGGRGGTQSGRVPVIPGQIVTVMVGGEGSGSVGGFNGGGGGNFGAASGAGGGASDIRVGGVTLADRVLVAGGGGGAGATGAGGGAGGGLTGQPGANGDGQWLGGGGGTQTEGGASGGNFGAAGKLGQGAGGAYKAGDGGGGYYGGGSGGSDSYGGTPGGGGGGSSYAAPFVTNATTAAGLQSGNGIVMIGAASPEPVPAADLALIQVGWPYGEVGSLAGYRLDITNAGPAAANRARLAVAVPDGISILNATVEGGDPCATLEPISCELGEIPAGSTKSVVVLLRLDVEGNLGSAASVSSAAADPATDNNALNVRTVAFPPERRLAAQYRPALLFDTGASERWRPLAIDLMLGESYKGGKRHQICYLAQGPRGATKKCQDITSEAGFTSAFTFLDLQGSGDDSYTPYSCKAPELNDCDTGPTSVLYYTPTADAGSGYHYIDYWWFFRWNDSPILSGDHEGDWEGVTVALDPTGPPANTGDPVAAFVLYAAHDGQSWSAYLGNPATVHTPVYIGEGTHSSNPVQCVQDCGWLERSYDGGRPWGRNFDPECGELCVRRLPDESTSWTFWQGRWGTHVEGLVSGGASPPSPGNQSRYRCVRSSFGDDCPETPFGPSSLNPLLSTSRVHEPSVFSIDDCDAWKGEHTALVWCDPAELRKAFAQHRLDERVAPHVRIETLKGRMFAAPGLTQVIGRALAVGDVVTVSGRTTVGHELWLRLQQDDKQWVAEVEVPALRAAEQAIARVRRQRTGPTVSIVMPDGRRIMPDEVREVPERGG